ncbi:MAG TPA: hypothetical protein ENN80_11465, partial [Candidatus Hydrogenedentes bacterium]|nr:hypothetical protein [Candidatus Hydrogenedentota bacterium]
MRPVSWSDVLVSAPVLLLCMLVVYWTVLFPFDELRWLGIGDANTEAGPMAFVMDYSIHQGELPLWNPLTYCGAPYAANPSRSLFYPPNLLRSLLTLNPTPYKTHVGLMLLVGAHILFAGVSAFLFARANGLSRPGAFVATFTFIFASAFLYRSLGHWRILFTLSWFPLTLLLLAHALEARPFTVKARFGIGAGLAAGMASLVGAPQAFTTFGFTLGAYYVVHRLIHPRPTLRQCLFGDAIALGLFGLTTALLAFVAVWPTLEFAAFSARGAAADKAALFVRPPERPPWNLLQLLATYSGSAMDSGIRFAGVGATLLAVAALFHARKHKVLLYTAMVYVTLDCALGPPFPCASLLIRLAPFTMSHPQRAVVFVCFFLGVLSGFGVDALATRPSTRRMAVLRSAVLLLSGGILLGTLWGCARPHPFLDVSWLVLALPAILGAAALAATWLPMRTAWLAGAVCLVVGEIVVWNIHYIPYFFHGNRAAQPGDIAYLKKQRTFWADNGRGTDPNPNWLLYDLEPAMNGYDPLHIERVHQVICARSMEDEQR